ncbi:hypothetical protein ACOSP7_009592 [Xanthoceras sorbifolium]
MRPSFALQRMSNNTSSTGTTKYGLKNECPRGTVPIRRMSKEEQLRSDFSFTQELGQSSTGFEFAGMSTKPGKYYGGGGLVSIYNPFADHGQFTSSVISIEGGPIEEFSTIRAGWMVNPSLYHDNHIRLYTIWGQLSSGAQIGCYNTYCQGFVQTNPSIPLDMVLELVSVIGGPQYYVKLMVSQDKETGNWWLTYSESDTPVGYWPSSLFANLKDGAQVLGWGGMVSTNTPQLPPMGNGDNGKIHSCTSLNATMDVPLTVKGNKCYRTGGNSYKYDYWGYSFYFGGNGGDTEKCSKRSTFH